MTDFQNGLVALLSARDRILYSSDQQGRAQAEREFTRLADSMRERTTGELTGIVDEIERSILKSSAS